MRGYVQPGVSITATAAAASSGDGVKMGNFFGIASGDAAIGEKLVLTTSAASGNTRIGLAVTSAANPSGSVNVRLDG